MNTNNTCLIIAGLLGCSSIQATEQHAEEDWDFKLTPYLWFAGLKGDVATIPPLPAAPIDVSASDALSDTESSLMFLFEAKKNRHGVSAGLTYSDVREKDTAIPAPINLIMHTTTKTTIGTLGYQYEAYRDESTMVNALAGLRYWKLDSELKFRDGKGVLAGKSISHDESWLDPVIGINAVTSFGPNARYYLSGNVGIGGFGVGSDMFYDLNANLGYQWNDAIGTAIGYRIFDVDYKDGAFLYDAKQQGFLLSLTWSF